MENIVDRILYFIGCEGLTKRKFYAQTSLSNGFLDKVSKIGSDKVEKILNAYPKINPTWLLTGKGDMLLVSEGKAKAYESSQELVQAQEPAVQLKKGIPLIPINAMAGFGSGETRVMLYDAKKYIVPEFEDLNVEFMIRVKGSSMYPKYNSGDVVACRKLPLDTFFQWNKVYVLDTVQGAMIKRIHKSEKEDTILCVSDNTKYEPFELYKSELYSLAIVLGVIRLE